jgi:molybdenum cofactor cytidylyltransferase
MEDFKPLLELGGKPAILKTIESLRMTGITNISVVLGYKADLLKPLLDSIEIPYVENPGYRSGMFSSVLKGIENLPETAKAFFILPADIPLIRRATIRRMISTFRKMTPAVVYPVFEEKRGHPPLINVRCIGEILAADPEDNLRSVLKRYEPDAWDLVCADQAIHLDMDTPKDYEALKLRLERHHIPTVEECMALMEIHNASEAVIKHGLAVAGLSKRIGASLNALSPSSIDTELLEAAGILHDIAKGQPSHARTGAAILLEEGFPRIAECIVSHMDLKLPDNDSWPISEREILYLADKIIEEDQIVSLEKRFARAEEKAAGNDGIICFIRKRKEVGRKLMDRIENCLRSSGQGRLPWEIEA